MLRKGHGGIYKAPTKEERWLTAKRRERDQIKFDKKELHILRMNNYLWDMVREVGTRRQGIDNCRNDLFVSKTHSRTF